jgi:hypothetical protein
MRIAEQNETKKDSKMVKIGIVWARYISFKVWLEDSDRI